LIPSLAGLGLNFVRTVLVALSIRKGNVRMYMDSPKEMELAGRFNARMLRWGLALLAAGFLFQIWSVSLESKANKVTGGAPTAG